MRYAMPIGVAAFFVVCALLNVDASAQQYDREGKVIPGTERPKSLVPPPRKPRERLPEQDVAPQPLAKQSEWLSVEVPNQDDIEVRIDAKSIAIGQDEVIRFVLSVKPPVGDAVVTFEGIRCDPSEWRQYATGRADGAWARNLTSKWQKTFDAGPSGIRHTLARDSFCESDGRPVYSPEVARDRIEHAAPASSVRAR